MNLPQHKPPPRISGFTLIRNGVKFDYPFLESLRSVLPLVDELIINVGRGDDETLDRIRAFAQTEGHDKVSYFESTWPLDDPEKKKAGTILSEQTNLALDRCQGRWCIYLQGDEVLHEADHGKIREALTAFENTPDVEGLLLNYVHFYGSYDVVQASRSAYRREVRIVKRSAAPRSVGDAQSFRKKDGSKLQVIHCPARVFHYGWVRSPEAMKEKTHFMDTLYHGDYQGGEQEPHTGDNYRYKRFWGLKKFKGQHPSFMSRRIQEKGWHWELERSPFVWVTKDLKKMVLDTFEKITGHRPFEYRPYRLIRPPKA